MNNINNKILFITGTPGVGKTTIANNLNDSLSKKYVSKLIKINELAIQNDLIQGEDLDKGYKIIDIDGLSKKLNEAINSFFSEKLTSKNINFSNNHNVNDNGNNNQDNNKYNISNNTGNNNSNNKSINNSNNNNNNNNFKIGIVEGHLSHLCNIENNIVNNINNISNEDNIHVGDIDCINDFKIIVLRLNPDILRNRLNLRNYSKNKIHENLEAEVLAVCTAEAYETYGKYVNEIDTTGLDITDVLKLVEDVLFNKKKFPAGNIDFMQWILD